MIKVKKKIENAAAKLAYATAEHSANSTCLCSLVRLNYPTKLRK